MQPSDVKYIAIFHCPECEWISEEIDYEVNTASYEMGTASADVNGSGELRDWFDTDCCDSGDNDWDGSPTYKCRECDHEMNEHEAKRRFIVYTMTPEIKDAFNRGTISLRDIVDGSDNQEITTEGIKSIPKMPEKPDCESKTMKHLGTGLNHDTTIGFSNHGIQCPECENIQAADKNEIYFTCIECDHEFTITNLRESLQNG